MKEILAANPLAGAFLIYMIAVNIICFLAFGWDKKKAEKGAWRIPEATLLLISAIGGSLGGLIGMMFFSHKTRKLKFRIALPALFVVHFIIYAYISNALKLHEFFS